MFKKPFSYEGRIGRLEFLYSLIILIVFFTIILLIGELIGKEYEPASYSLFILFIPALWFFLAVRIKRLHDMNISGYFLLWSFIPAAILFLDIYMLFGKGTKGSNPYGPNPYSTPGGNKIETQ